MSDPSHPPAPLARWPRRRLIAVAAVTSWALLITALAFISARNDPPTVRDQRSIGAAAPVVERILGEVAAAGGSSGGPAVLALGSQQIDEGCRLTTVRRGATLSQQVTLYTTPADGPAMLERIANGLSTVDRVWIGRDPDGVAERLSADAGDFVGLRGEFAGPGVLRLTAESGCRPPSEVETEPPAAETSLSEGAALAERILASLGVRASRDDAAAVSCPAGGFLGTAMAGGYPTTALGRLADVLEPQAAGAPVLIDEPDRYVYGDGSPGVAVEVVDGEVLARVTTGCAA